MDTPVDPAEFPPQSANGALPQRPLRVLVPFNTTALYGMERSVLEMFAALRPDVVPHFVLTRAVEREKLAILPAIQAHGFTYSFLRDHTPWPKIGKPRSLGHLGQLLRAIWVGNLDVLAAARETDAIYLASLHYYSYAFMASALTRMRGGRVIFRFHDLVAEPTTWNKLFNVCPFLFTDVVHNTRLSQEWMLDLFPRINRVRNSVIPQITRLRTGKSDPAVEAAFRGRRNLVFVGQMARHKGVDLLLQAFVEVAQRYPDVHLHLLGVVNNAEFEPEFQRLLEHPALRGRCTHWGYRDDVHQFFRDAYLHVQPSRPSMFHESFGRGAVEAMAVGVPTLCLESGALQEIVRHEQTGLVVREETPQAVANGLRRVLDHPELREAFSAACLRDHRERFAEERVRELWLEFFAPALT